MYFFFFRCTQVWKDHLDKSIAEAGKKEYLMAVKNGDLDEDGTPFTTVIVDGGWSKRSYGHNFNASSGVVSTNRFP